MGRIEDILLNGVFQKPYIFKDGRGAVKKKQDEDTSKSPAQAQREEQANSNSRSKGLQYTEQAPAKNTAYTRNYQKETPVDWQTMRSQIQGQVAQRRSSNQTQTSSSAAQINNSSNALQKNSTINIAQILKDFNNTAIAIGTPQELKEEVDGYLALVQKQVQKDNPNTKLIKSNLKNASTILDNYISQTLNKDSKVVENWVDALFLQQIDFKYNENDVNKQFLVKFPEGSTKQAENVEQTEQQPSAEQPSSESIAEETDAQTPVQSLIPQDKELKSLFLQSKKFAYANEPKKALAKFQEALQRADEVGDTETKSKIYYEVGKIYDDHSYMAQALKSYNKSLEHTTDNNIKTKVHYSMAQIYDDVNQISTALDHYFNSVSFAGEAENLVAQSASLTRMGNIYTDMYEQQSFDYYAIAGDLAEQTDNSKIKGFISSSMAGAYEKFGEPQEALHSYSKAVQHYTDAESPQKVAQNYRDAAEIMLDYNNPSKAKGLLLKAQNFATQAEDENLLNEINEKLESLAA